MKSAIKKLIEKGYLTLDNKLTDIGFNKVEAYYHERHEYPSGGCNDYLISDLDLYDETLIDLPFSGNGSGPVFRWYKYLEDFSHFFVSEPIEKYKVSKKYYVMDPYAGSGTTLIQSRLDGYKSIGLDVNPVMVFISNVKLGWSVATKELIKEYNKILHSYFKLTEKEKVQLLEKSPLWRMPRRELNQWLSPIKQKEIGAVMSYTKKVKNKDVRDLLRFIITKVAVDVSYVVFCPRTTFYPFRKKPAFFDRFREVVLWVIRDLKNDLIKETKEIEAKVELGSCKDTKFMKRFAGKVDLIITSPPYPNDLEYTRQTRLEMYLLGYVKSMSDIQMVKKQMVKGSTKLIFNTDKPNDLVISLPVLKKIITELRVRLKDKNWGFDYLKMIEMYFSDMVLSMENFRNILVENGVCILVVGDQTIKGVVIPVARILSALGKKAGFRDCKIEPHRRWGSVEDLSPIIEEDLILFK